MQDSALILSEYEEINSLLYKPIIATQRIKYTCINISTNYIVLGSTSGSLYLFTRESCIFQQLIPLSEGPVVHVLISPDEKTIALATKRGNVCIVNLRPTIKLLSVSNEHINESITCLCWNDKSTEIYVGDKNGKISTIVLSIFTVNGMFQPPTCALMHLDSSIVQMDFALHYLLVSTLTRCYICDTAQEQFKQIGNKARDGEFGACLFKTMNECGKKLLSNMDDDKMMNKASGFNSIIGVNDDNGDEQRNLIVYCARPGCRLWEVTTNGVVIKTHQFKDALAIPSSNIYVTATIELSQKKIDNKNGQQQLYPIQTHNFSRLIVVNRKYLLSYTTNSLYIIDPVNAAVILWCDEFTNILMAHVIDDKIYLMTISGQFHCLTLSNIDSLIIKLFNYKMYNDCLQLCTIYRGDLLKLIDCNDKIIQIIDGEIKIDVNNLQINDITALLQSIISTIQPNVNAQPHKLNSGIVMVHSGNCILRSEINNRSLTPTETRKKFDINNYMKNNKTMDHDYESSSDTDIVCNDVIEKKENLIAIDKHQQQSHENSMEMINRDISKINLNNCDRRTNPSHSQNQDANPTFTVSGRRDIEIATSNIQSDLEPVNILIASLKSSMKAENIESVIREVNKKLLDVNNEYEGLVELKEFLFEIIRSTERLYYHILLENITSELLSTTDNTCILNEIIKAFVDLNSSNYTECFCGYPHASDEQLNEPKFVELGQTLIEKFLKANNNEKFISLIKCVPYYWREYLSIYVNQNGIIDDNIIRLCLQTRDNIILSILLPLLNTKQWEIAIASIKRMQIDRCLFCNRNLDTSSSTRNNLQVDWSGVAHEIIKKQKPDAALAFLQLLETKLPTIKLKPKIYQSLIFTKLLSRHGVEHTVEFDNDKVGNNEFSSLCSAEVRDAIVGALERDLERPVNKNIFGNGAHHWGMLYKPKSSVCPSCTLSLQTPVLLGSNGISIFPCGHAYHVNCLIQKKLTTCFLHQ